MGHLVALTRSHLIGDHPSGLTKEQTTETMDPTDSRIRCLAERNLEFFYHPTLIFCSFLDNVEVIVNNICSEKKSRGRRTSKIVKSKQAIAMAICPIIVHFSTSVSSGARCVTWHVNLRAL